jgi:hypothetical protein
MSTLTLFLKKESLGTEINFGVVARVQGYVLGASQDDEPFYREVVIPASRGSGVDVTVPPGRYRVQAILPSGEILQQERKIADEETVSIAFEARSERAWLSWQNYDGTSAASSLSKPSTDLLLPESAPLQDELLQDLPFARLRTTFSRLLNWSSSKSPPTAEPFPDVWRGVRNEASLTIHEQQPLPDGDALWLRAAAALQAVDFVGDWPAVQDGGLVQARRVQHEETLSLWHIESGRLPAIVSEKQDPIRRYWAMSEVADVVEVQSLPLPWQNDDEAALLEILVDSTDRDVDARTSTIVRDPALGGMLAYLGRGRLANARPLMDSLDQVGLIEQTIRAKRQNPLAACAAAYVGLAIFEPGERERWDSWLSSLMNWFPWLPDGAIVHARRVIQRPRHPEEKDDALQALKRAYRCGIPYFTAGVLHLRDSLVLFANKDEQAREMLKNVSGVATRIDTGQAFTLLRFPKV